MKHLNFIRKALLVAFSVFILASCREDESPITDDGNRVDIKFAEDVTKQDKRDWGTEADWLGSNGQLSMLGKQQLQDVSPELFISVPEGIQTTEPTYLYVTIVGKAASFNNVLGYYYRPLDEGFTKEEFFEQVLVTGQSGTYFRNIICTSTKGVEHGMTFRLSTKEGDPIPANHVVGFCLYPNAGAEYKDPQDLMALPNMKIHNDQPVFITTCWEFNSKEQISHVVGQSQYGDFAFAFEDRNSFYNDQPDNDYNDLVLMVTGNLDSRVTTGIYPYNNFSSAFPFGYDDDYEGCMNEQILIIQNFETGSLREKIESYDCYHSVLKIKGKVPFDEKDRDYLKTLRYRVTFDFSEYTFQDNTIPDYFFAYDAILVLPKSIEKIGRYAFSKNRILETANFPDLKEVGNGAFYMCRELKSIDFPKLLTVGDSAFAGCYKVKTINLPEANIIGRWAFMDLTQLQGQLTSVDLPKATWIGYQAFAFNSELREVKFEGAVEIEPEVLSTCYNLKKLWLGPNLKDMTSYLMGRPTHPRFPYPDGMEIIMKSPPPSIGYVRFGDNIKIHVPERLLSEYEKAGWGDLGNLVGYYPEKY